MTPINDFMILGGAVMTSALVATSAQMVTLASILGVPPPAAVGAAVERRALRLGGGGGLALQFIGDFFGVGVAQIPHLDVAAGRRGRIHIEDKRLESQALRSLTGQQDAVGALIGDHLDGGARALRALALIERIDDAHHLGGTGVLQRDDFDRLIAALVHALDNAHHAAHVAGPIRNDQHVARGIGREMPIGAEPEAAASAPAPRRSHSST